jgi:hypothetical protein
VIAHNKKWDLVQLNISTSEIQKQGKEMHVAKYIRLTLQGLLKQAAKELKRARWRDLMVVEVELLATTASWLGRPEQT